MDYAEYDMASSPDSPAGHNIDFALQRYLLLHNQHQELRQHLHDLCPSYSTSPTAVASPSVSPTRTSPGFSPPRNATRNHRRSSGASSRSSSMRSSSSSSSSGYYSGSSTMLEPVLDESLVQEMADGEQKLFDVNEGIKRALTELLNCERIRGDRTMRSWVQCRLMETEKELRSGRRRRSNGSADC